MIEFQKDILAALSIEGSKKEKMEEATAVIQPGIDRSACRVGRSPFALDLQLGEDSQLRSGMLYLDPGKQGQQLF